MPGIHVRTSGKYDYTEREKEPILTVPGSYWLCHRKNIYKFTFKYHRSSRDSKEFDHGKELMKVIRRIIKSQPRQGQQFGTHHLLVTYNHSSWTRQDKMFAMLKFRDRTDAVAFPRAFILTIKPLTFIATSNNNDEYDNDLIVYKKDTKNSRWNDSMHRNSNTDKIKNLQDRKYCPAIITDETSSDSSTRLTPINSKNIRVGDHLSTNESIEGNDQSKTTNSNLPISDLDDIPLLERFLLEQQDQSEEPEERLSPPRQERLNEMQETIDMPYQYLIEREIERTKKNHITNNSNIQKNATVDKTIDKLLSESSSVEISKSQNHPNPTSSVDNTTARSANITDLVMEGLMFTIRQDQDTVTVMEQKTKLEPDEVLENSEKVETKEGGECLVNSSLLKLENLITKIDRSSSTVKSVSRFDKDYEKFSISFLHKVNKGIGNDQEYSYGSCNFKNENQAIINMEIPESNKPAENTINAPKTFRRLFKNYNEVLNNSELSLGKININNIQDIKNQMINTNNDENPVNKVTNIINISIEENKIEKSFVDKNLWNPYVQLHRKIDSESHKSSEDQMTEEDRCLLKSVPKTKTTEQYTEDSSSSIGPDKKNSVKDDSALKQSIQMLDTSESRNKLKVPRIISTEIVKYDLSSLRSSRLRKRFESNEDCNDSKINEDVHKECLSNVIISNKKELKELQSSDEKKNHNITPTNRRRLTARRRLHTQKNVDELTETTIEMWKFIQDMTQGVRVVLERLDLSRVSGGVGKNC